MFEKNKIKQQSSNVYVIMFSNIQEYDYKNKIKQQQYSKCLFTNVL